ncbi:MAG: hypothetical protein KDD35_00290 [Bdellovibrionales bacterium]|nr:hypothetical protein [Bdellovibrionales bacterium]
MSICSRQIAFTLFLVLALGTGEVRAQNIGPNGTSEQSSLGPRKQMATIIFAGLAGAILGLSTLSFYGRPQDKLPNIGMGLAVGIISGTIYTTYLAATRPRTYFEGSLTPLNEQEVYILTAMKTRSFENLGTYPQLSWQWSF